MFGTVHFVLGTCPENGMTTWLGSQLPNPTTPKRKVFALIPNTPGAHSICVHCAAKDPTRGLAAGYVSYVSSFLLGWFWGRGVGVVVSWKICSKK